MDFVISMYPCVHVYTYIYTYSKTLNTDGCHITHDEEKTVRTEQDMVQSLL